MADLSAYALDEPTNTLTLTDTHPNVAKRGGKAGREREYVYTFDQLHLPPHETTALYERHIASLVDKAMAGFNSTIFAYGQTGSGKTHTMSGTDDEVGVIPLAVSGVFEAIEQNPSRHYLLRVSYLEIYNETLRDILNFSKKPLSDQDKPSIHLENVSLLLRLKGFACADLGYSIGRSLGSTSDGNDRAHPRGRHLDLEKGSKESKDGRDGLERAEFKVALRVYDCEWSPYLAKER